MGTVAPSLHRALNVVDGDVVPRRPRAVCFLSPDSMGVPVKPMNEALGRGVPQVGRAKAVDEVILAPVRLIRDDDDVAPVGEKRVLVAALFRGRTSGWW